MFLHIPGNVLAGYAGSLALTVKVVQFPHMLTHYAFHLCTGQGRQQFACVQIVLDFPEDPGSSLSSTTNHQRVCAGVVQYCSGFKRVSNVAIGNNRDGNSLLNCPDVVVFGFTIKQTGAGPAMDRKSLNTATLGQS